MQKGDGDKARVIFPPPLMFFIALGAAAGMEYVLPLRLQAGPWLPRIVVGAALLVTAGVFAVSSIVVLTRNHTPFDPARPTKKIITSGPFRFSRNPMYLSLLLSLVGLAALICSVWFLVLVPFLWVALDYGAVRPEERYLIEKFGDTYRKYMRDVRRWL